MSATKRTSVNIVIALLLIVSLLLLVKPCYFAEDDSTSVMGYIFMVTDHDQITDLFEEAYPGFVLNGQVWMPILMFAFGLGALYMMIAKRSMTSGLILPMVYCIFGIIICWTNQLTRFGGVAVWQTVVLTAAFILCLMNGNWDFGAASSAWTADPHAKSKLKDIGKAVRKKNLNSLKAYAQSQDVEIRVAAIEGIAKVGGNDAFQALVMQLNCTNPDVRIAAAKALSDLGDARSRSFILHYMESDPDSRVRSAMRKALSGLSLQSI
ncbi:MAG: HEAT repeat domain-containing protein [Clostridia bacterium]|nr:HEAT repeat domain-containing protein [Clostridia bacterium]